MLSDKLAVEYFKIVAAQKKEYGEHTLVLMQVGSFYTAVDEEHTLNTYDMTPTKLHVLSKILNVAIAGAKNTNMPNFVGFPCCAFEKYMPILFDHGYTVVIVDEYKEKDKTHRAITGTYSSTMYPIHLENEHVCENTLMSVLIEVYPMSSTCAYSLAFVNTSTNTFDIYSNSVHLHTHSHSPFDTLLDECIRIMVRYNVSEMLVMLHEDAPLLSKEYLSEYINLHIHRIHVKRYTSSSTYHCVEYQNDYFKRVYSHVSFGLLSPIEYMELAIQPLCVLHCMYTLDFLSRHDARYIQHMCLPKFIQEYNHLVLELNTVHQLHLVGSGSGISDHKYASLLHVIDKTCTAMGKRALKQLLCKPFRNTDEIQERYHKAALLETLSYNIETPLQDIYDIERLHRKMSLQALHPYEFYRLHVSYMAIKQLHDTLCVVDTGLGLSENVVEQLEEYIQSYTSTFDVERLQQYRLNETAISIQHFFKSGVITELDTLYGTIQHIEQQVEAIRCTYEKKVQKEGDWLKTMYSDQEGYYFTCTKIRTQALQKALTQQESQQLTVSSNKSACKLFDKELTKLSHQLTNTRMLFLEKTMEQYKKTLAEYSSTYHSLFMSLKTFVETTDILNSNVKCKRLYKYCQPTLVDRPTSFVKATGLRHPIIERINTDTAYVPNDIALDTQHNGMILYALNSCGKSSLLRALGMAVVMAQCGMYVPCDSFEYAPFDNLATQVDMSDNIWKAQSSFVSEMIGLRRIMSLANDKTLVLSDELTKGTEVVSATSIFAATVLELCKKGAKFIFTTHLQDVAKLEEIKSCEAIRIQHLSIEITDDTIVFHRRLQDGPCSELYGLEVAKAVGLDPTLLDLSFEIRNKLVNAKQMVFSTKKSRYNKNKVLDMCEICGYTPTKATDIPLDTHHIQFQCNADQTHFNGHYHKNSKFNLVALCKSCHIKVHEGTFTIHGYIQTTKGTVLSWNK